MKIITVLFHSLSAIRASHICLCIFILALAVLPGFAATYTVANANDSGVDSLRAAVMSANSTPENDIIVFDIPACPNGDCRIVLSSGVMIITSSDLSGALTILNPPGPTSLTISGNNSDQIFTTIGPNAIKLDGLTLENGVGHYGGAIYNAGNLTVSNSIIKNNRAVFGAGIFNRGVSTSGYGSLVVTKSEIKGNVAGSDLYPSYGGGIFADDSSFVLIRDSTIADNSAAQSGGGIGLSSYEYGPFTVIIANSSISRNSSAYGGGIDAYGGFYGDLRITNTTIAMNSGGGLHITFASLFTRNSIIAGNAPSDLYTDSGVLINLGNNLIGESPLLGPLANNGGPARTLSLLPGSLAIDAGDNCVLTANGCGDDNPAIPSDQRGFGRVGAVDIGAFEFDPSARRNRALLDFDGDGRADVSVFRPTDSVWYLNGSAEGFSATQFGLPTDKIVPADYDGDRKTDIAVFRDGTWWILESATDAVRTFSFGLTGDIPVPADYTGDGRDELAVYRGGQWWSLDLTNYQSSVTNFGLATDRPVVADYDGDGLVDQAIYRNGEWHINRSSLGYEVLSFGLPTDVPVVGDYDGDGKADLAVYRDGAWYLQQSLAGFRAFHWGVSTDIPAPADYDGDGKTDATVYRDGVWYQLTSSGGISIQQFGLIGDKPLPGAFISAMNAPLVSSLAKHASK